MIIPVNPFRPLLSGTLSFSNHPLKKQPFSVCPRSSTAPSFVVQPQPSLSHLTLSPERSSRLRDRAGVPSFDPIDQKLKFPTHHHQSGNLENDFKPMKPWTPQGRTQVERSHMTYGETSIISELLQDLSIPLDELSDGIEKHKSDILFDPQVQSILSQNSKRKSLSRHRPIELSIQDMQTEDILKELVDQKIKIIDGFDNHHDLIKWADSHVFASQSKQPMSKTDFNFVGSFQLIDQPDFDLTITPEYLSQTQNSSLSCTPLLSPILLHLMNAFSTRFHNPNLSLYLFEFVRSHSDPLIKYFGLTKDVYLEMMKIRWNEWKDFEGIKDDLVEMKSLGIEIDERIKKLVQSITAAVLKDEISAEQRVNDHSFDSNINLYRQISPSERRAVAIMESVVNEFIDAENRLFARRFRINPFESSV
ncbi:hypothetical protein O181_064939 [Austropuccinia psidii MF-1]|uniref:Mtf2-like C-terminal domain-containing protein n=1 Tax=Austropuccinia psidii MF-1 TaxID=1389203 RepID=A0A9Q3EQ49_9BASI|nr:hypothetical protein [Austropuccinia psidii MF-1]